MNVEDFENLLNSAKPEPQLKTIRIGVVGSRRRTSYKEKKKLFDALAHLCLKYRDKCKEIILVSGGCPEGADAFAKEYADLVGIKIEEFLPQIEDTFTYYQRVLAYYARNELIAKNSDFIIAMPAPDRKGGTENTIGWAETYKKKVVLL